jgi:hypothetical protein
MGDTFSTQEGLKWPVNTGKTDDLSEKFDLKKYTLKRTLGYNQQIFQQGKLVILVHK